METLYRENVSFRDRDLIRLTRCHMASENFDAELLLHIRVSIKMTWIIILTNIFSYTFINQSIDILLEFWRFFQSSEHRFPPCLHPELATTWYDTVQVSIFVTCLNFADTGSWLWQLYVAFVMTWYLAFKTSGRTAKAAAKAVRPVISGKFWVFLGPGILRFGYWTATLFCV